MTLILEILQDVDMKVYPTYECKGDCPFCMTDLRYKAEEVPSDVFIENFKAAFRDYYKNGGRKVLFTGGEPTLRPEKVLGMLEFIKSYDLALIVLYTNGTRLLDYIDWKKKHKTLIGHLANEGLHAVNLTANHYDVLRRCEIFHDGQSDPAAIASESRKVGIGLRLNCTLIKDYIGNIDEIKKYLEWAASIGITDVYFRDLFHLKNRELSTRHSNRDKLKFSDDHRVDYNALTSKVEKDSSFVLKNRLTRHKDHGKTLIFKYGEIQVSFGSLEVGNENPEEFTYFTFMPDGKVYKNMNGPESLAD